MQRRILSMPDRYGRRNEGSTKVFTRPHVRAASKFQRGDFFAPFQFDARNLQKSFLATSDKESAGFHMDRSWR